MESKAAYSFDRRIIQSFMDIVILKHLKNNHPMSGYDTIKYFHKKFHMLPSSGTVYSLMYSLERKGLIEGNTNNGKRVYELTKEGEEYLRQIHNRKSQIQTLVLSIF